MTHRPLRAAFALALLACSNTAHASAAAGAVLSDLHIQLFSTGAGPASVMFNSVDGSLAHVLASSTTPGALSFDESAFGSAALAPVASGCHSNANVACDASITGDAYTGDATADVSAFAGNAFGAQVEAFAGLADGANYASFELSAHTVMVITATSDLYAQAGADGLDYAEGTSFLQLSGSEGDNSQSSTANSLVLAGGGFADRAVRHSLLSVSFVNAFDDGIEGTFFGGIDAVAVSSVPEPATLWMLLAGAVGFSVKARQRRDIVDQ